MMDWIKDYRGWRIYSDGDSKFEARKMDDPCETLSADSHFDIELAIDRRSPKKPKPVDYDMEDFWAAGW